MAGFITTSAFNQLMAYCYVELAVSFLAVAVASSIIILPTMEPGGGIARLSWFGCFCIEYEAGAPAKRSLN